MLMNVHDMTVCVCVCLILAEPEGGGAPALCHSVASAASFRTYDSSTLIRIFSGLMSVWMI